MAGKKGDAPFLAHHVASAFAAWPDPGDGRRATPHGITVNSICPGFVATAMQEREAAWEAELRGVTPTRSAKALYVG
ncbi:MAG: hypothetical protein R3C32_11770 [Chloroflexota bacterium]